MSQYIAPGSTAEVFRGTIGGREVAIKKFNLVLTRSNVIHQQLVRELEMCTNYRHPHLLPLLAACTDPSCLCLVSPYMSMGTLSDVMANPLLKTQHIADWRTRLLLGIQVADALDYLHTPTAIKPQVVHRDVKLTNILLRNNTQTRQLEAVLCDLGIARVFQDGATVGAETRVMGTNGYIDPEYLRTQGVSKSSDIFALGVVLLQFLTGDPLAFNNSAQPIPALYLRMRPYLDGRGFMIAEGNVWQRNIAEYLGWLIHSCTADVIPNRPETCRMIATTLRHLLNFEPAPAAPAVPRDARRSAPVQLQRECSICFGENGPINCRFLPCMHSCVCLADANRLMNARLNCPLCRRPIQRIEQGQYDHTNTAV